MNWVGCVSTPEGAQAYFNGRCKKCLIRPRQAGSTMCYECWPLRTPSATYASDTTIVYHMTDDDIALAERIGTEWQRVNAVNGVKEARKDGRTDRPEKLSIDGLWAEIAFSKVYGLQFDPRTTLIAHAPDYVIRGKSLDIKASDRADGNLIAPLHKRAFDADLYVLGLIDKSTRTVRFVGWHWGRELISQKRLVPLGVRNVLTYRIMRYELQPMYVLAGKLGLGAAA